MTTIEKKVNVLVARDFLFEKIVVIDYDVVVVVAAIATAITVVIVFWYLY